MSRSPGCGGGPARRARFDLGDGAALLVTTIWGVNFAFVKATLMQFDVRAFTFLRFVGMVALAWIVLASARRMRRGSQGGVAPSRADLGRLVIAGVVGHGAYQLLFVFGLQSTTAFSTALLLNTTPAFTSLLLWGLRLEAVATVQWAATAVSFLGVLVFVYDKLRVGLASAGMGDLLSVLAALCFAVYNVVNKPLLSRYPATALTTYTLTIGAVPLLAVSLPGVVVQDWGRVSGLGWAGLLWSVVVPVYVAWTLWTWVSSRLGVARTATFIYVVPIVSAMASWVLLGERFGALKVAGALMVLGGLVIARASAPAAVPPRDPGPAPRAVRAAVSAASDGSGGG
ncbi:MAG TPA: DMT family transporter [bacterium]|nr:DMT family transporter [bacterium]